MKNREFDFYDYECTGLSYMYDRPVQFAGLKTDGDFNIISDPIDIKCRLSDEVLMAPRAALVHGLTPEDLDADGINEPEFAQLILKFFSKRNATKIGYNTESYDKHFTRHMLYRCMLPPYDYEWRNGASRWDAQTVLRGIYAVAKDTLSWPVNDEGNVTFKLEKFCEANGIAHDGAHDALVDIVMTIEVMRCIHQCAPEWLEFFHANKDKQSVTNLLGLNKRINDRFVVHSDYVYGKETNYVAPLVPICYSPTDNMKVICIDLRGDIDEFYNLPPELINKLLYTKKDDLPTGVSRPCIAQVTINSCPLLIPISHFSADKFADNNLDQAHCREQFKKLLKYPDMEEKLKKAFATSVPNQESDVDGQLYFGAGFIPAEDLEVIKRAHAEDVSALSKSSLYLRDSRMKELLFRYRAKYMSSSLSPSETMQWQNFVKSRLSNGYFTITDFWKELAEVTDELSGDVSDRDRHIVESLRRYGITTERKLAAFAKPNI